MGKFSAGVALWFILLPKARSCFCKSFAHLPHKTPALRLWFTNSCLLASNSTSISLEGNIKHVEKPVAFVVIVSSIVVCAQFNHKCFTMFLAIAHLLVWLANAAWKKMPTYDCIQWLNLSMITWTIISLQDHIEHVYEPVPIVVIVIISSRIFIFSLLNIIITLNIWRRILPLSLIYIPKSWQN